jgi:glucan phosphoethanolaminetransferase (alkaline phosphatase superfamily)
VAIEEDAHNEWVILPRINFSFPQSSGKASLDPGAVPMMAMAVVTFLFGIACAFALRLLAFSMAAIAVTALAATLAALGFGFGMSAGMAALTAGVATQLGYAAGIALRTVIAPFPVSRANERGGAPITDFGRP